MGALDKPELLALLSDLYDRSADNRRLVDARLYPNLALGTDRDAISSLMDPSDADRPRIAQAKRVIADFKKSVKDPEGEVDLMIHFVECGNAYTLRYGDIDAGFYDALIRMYERATARVASIPEPRRNPFVLRLKALVESTEGLGWGYHDGLSNAFQTTFPSADS